MKKIFDKSLAMVTSMMLISTSAINASEYIVSNYTENHKDKIYEIVSKYRFPSILSPFTQKEFQKKYPNLELIETFKTKESGHRFIQNATYNITKDTNTVVYSIPKSLYQFMVYDYFAENNT